MDSSNMILTGPVLPPSLLEYGVQGLSGKTGLNPDVKHSKDSSNDRKVQAARDFDLPYDDMCITDQSECPAVTAQQDVRDWVDGL